MKQCSLKYKGSVKPEDIDEFSSSKSVDELFLIKDKKNLLISEKMIPKSKQYKQSCKHTELNLNCNSKTSRIIYNRREKVCNLSNDQNATNSLKSSIQSEIRIMLKTLSKLRQSAEIAQRRAKVNC
mmetsp:Transcript_12704/g.14515  ORF Transcript_12704/g.14515 Transcript_12704/m.14515 type:complete len:126 (-) Transcript_12704:77-454(-)